MMFIRDFTSPAIGKRLFGIVYVWSSDQIFGPILRRSLKNVFFVWVVNI